MKKRLSVSLLTLIIALTLPSKINATGNSLKTIKNLKINPSSTYQTVCYKSENAGIRDLEKLFKEDKALKSDFEESWVFIPMRDSTKSKWVETGIINFKTVRDTIYSIGVDVDKKIFEKLAKEYQFLIDYHIHPMIIPKNLIKERASEIFKSKQNTKSGSLEELTAKLEQNYLALSALPSTGDINFAVMRTRQMKKINPTLRINFKICSTYGITSYNLTSKGKAIFGRELSPESYLSWLNEKEKNNLPLDFNQKLDKTDLVRYFASFLNDSLLQIDFQPYTEFYPQKIGRNL